MQAGLLGLTGPPAQRLEGPPRASSELAVGWRDRSIGGVALRPLQVPGRGERRHEPYRRAMRSLSRGVLAVAMVAVAGPVLVGCGTYEDGIEIGTVANTVVRYYRGIEHQDCPAITAELTPELASSLDCEQLTQAWAGLSSADIAYRSGRTTKIDGSEASVVARIRRQPVQAGCSTITGDSTVTHRLVVVDDAWRIASVSVTCD